MFFAEKWEFRRKAGRGRVGGGGGRGVLWWGLPLRTGPWARKDGGHSDQGRGILGICEGTKPREVLHSANNIDVSS